VGDKLDSDVVVSNSVVENVDGCIEVLVDNVVVSVVIISVDDTRTEELSVEVEILFIVV
jgi:hypothetical protein